MKFKMRALHFSPAGNAERVANEIARAQQCNSDRIPPAYPLENEKLLFLGVELKGNSVDKAVLAHCKDLSPNRVKNVAIFAISGGNFAAIDEVKQMIKDKGIAVVGTTYECTIKSGFLKKGAVSDADVKSIVAWAGAIVDSM